MKTGKQFGVIASSVMLAALLLSQSGGISAATSPNNSDLFFIRHIISTGYVAPSSMYPADIDGDGDVDVCSAALMHNEINWWENDGNGSFTGHTIHGSYWHPTSVYATDLDADGDTDVLAAGDGSFAFGGEVTWWQNDGNEQFTQQTIDANFPGAASVYATDVDGDGDKDVLAAGGETNQIAWWENDGDEHFSKHIVDDNYEAASFVLAADLDGDDDVDVLGSSFVAGQIAWWENNGEEVFLKHTIDAAFAGVSRLHAADVDSDGDVDVLGTASIDDAITWWENDGDGTLVRHDIDDAYNGATSVYAVDLDQDGDMDVLGAARDAGEITWWENDGHQAWTEHTVDRNFAGAVAVHASDVNGDGGLNVLGATFSGETIAWWSQGVGRVFLPCLVHNFPPMPPPPPELYAISNPDGDSIYTVDWSAAASATSYTLEQDDNLAFSSPAVAYSGPDTSTAIHVGAVGTYYYRVSASNEHGTSDWSNVQSVVVSHLATFIEPGHYTGVNPTVSFDVTTDQQVCSFAIRVPFMDDICALSFSGCAPIENRRFEFVAIDPWTNQYENKITGYFDTLTHATGTYSVHWCGTWLIFDPSEGSWSASKQ